MGLLDRGYAGIAVGARVGVLVPLGDRGRAGNLSFAVPITQLFGRDEVASITLVGGELGYETPSLAAGAVRFRIAAALGTAYIHWSDRDYSQHYKGSVAFIEPVLSVICPISPFRFSLSVSYYWSDDIAPDGSSPDLRSRSPGPQGGTLGAGIDFVW